MKRCLACKALFERADWTCPNCGYQPALPDEIRQFMDERSETHAGFKPEYFARLASSRNQISGFVRGTSSFRGAPHRRALISHLAGLGILVLFHYLPLHLSPMRLRFGGRQGDCSVTEDLADRLLRFPFFTGMSSSDPAQVIDAVRAFRC